MNAKIKTFFLIGAPRSSRHKERETFYEKGFILDSQQDWEMEYVSLENCDLCALPWKIMEKAKTFICAFLNAAIPGTIYFGVANSEESSSQQNVAYNHGEILGLDVENIKGDIIKAFQFVLDTQISSDQGGLLREGSDQNCVSIHFIPVKIQGISSKLCVVEIDVLRDWLLCKDNVFFCKSWVEAPRQEVEEKDSSRKGLSNFFMVKEHWDDVFIRENGKLHRVKPLDVHKSVRQRLREWYNKRGPEAQRGMHILLITLVIACPYPPPPPVINWCKGKYTQEQRRDMNKNVTRYLPCHTLCCELSKIV